MSDDLLALVVLPEPNVCATGRGTEQRCFLLCAYGTERVVQF